MRKRSTTSSPNSSATRRIRFWSTSISTFRPIPNGAILFVFIADRKMRIEVGYGLEGALTDAKSKRIIEMVIKPQFQRGDYAAGIVLG